MQIDQHHVHIWTTSLAITPELEQQYLTILSTDESARAMRFKFPEHKRRFIAARAILRQILNLYTNIAPDKLEFSYGEHDKPALAYPANTHLQFNLAHSNEIAIYAIARQHVGVDIEKIKPDYNEALAKRFFSAEEVNRLLEMPEAERVSAFYRLWAKKEAILKATGKGLAISLSSFSVSPYDLAEVVTVDAQQWYLQSLTVDPAFQSALATEHAIDELMYYQFDKMFLHRH